MKPLILAVAGISGFCRFCIQRHCHLKTIYVILLSMQSEMQFICQIVLYLFFIVHPPALIICGFHIVVYADLVVGVHNLFGFIQPCQKIPSGVMDDIAFLLHTFEHVADVDVI